MKLSSLCLSLVLVANCAASSATPARPWRVELASSGGLAGRGMGTYAVTSDAKVTATLPNQRSCTFDLTAEELRRFEDVLAAARPREWQASYVPKDPCCDRFEYDLTLDQAGTETKVKWIDDPLPMPADLTALTNALTGGESSIRALASERCK